MKNNRAKYIKSRGCRNSKGTEHEESAIFPKIKATKKKEKLLKVKKETLEKRCFRKDAQS